MQQRNISSATYFWHMIMLAASLVIFTSCCIPRSVLEKQPDYMIRHLDDMTTDAVSHMLQQQRASFDTFRVVADIHVSRAGIVYDFREECRVKKPASLRCTVPGRGMRDLIIFSSDGTMVVGHSTQQQIAYTGDATPTNIEILRGIPLSTEDMVSLLAGHPPLLSSYEYEWGFYIPPNRIYFLERHAIEDDLGHRIWIDTETKAVIYFQAYRLSTGEVTLTAEAYPQYRRKYDDIVPRRIEVTVPAGDRHMWLRFKEFEANPTFHDSNTFPHSPIAQETTLYQLDDPQNGRVPLSLYRQYGQR